MSSPVDFATRAAARAESASEARLAVLSVRLSRRERAWFAAHHRGARRMRRLL